MSYFELIIVILVFTTIILFMGYFLKDIARDISESENKKSNK